MSSSGNQNVPPDSDPNRVFVASYPGPIYCDAPPGTEATESSSNCTTASTKTSVSVAQNSGYILVCDTVNILPDNTLLCERKRKHTDNDDSILVNDTTMTTDHNLKLEGTPTPKRVKINRDLIKKHILSYTMMMNQDGERFLPRRLTKDMMYKDFISKNPSLKCSKAIYTQKMKDMQVLRRDQKNICFTCRIAEDIKKKHEEHKHLAESALIQFKLDTFKTKAEDLIIYSMALQEVILLPEMPHQDVFHVSRLVTYNMTFEAINKTKKPCVSVMWHEAMAGGDDVNIVDAIMSFINTKKNVVHFNFWADDSARYRNWTLYTAFSYLVNSNVLKYQTITIKYLKEGHSDMAIVSTDLLQKIEHNMKREEAIYDFNELKDIVRKIKKNLNVIEVHRSKDWPNKSNGSLDSLLSSFIEVKFARGYRGLFYRTDFQDDMTEIDFMIEGFDINTFSPTFIDKPRGINPEKKDNIISKLVPSMPEKNKSFWLKLPVNENSLDLLPDEFNLE